MILAGTATGQKLADAYNAMDIFAFSSKSVPQGMVLIEAMAAGIPVIALDAPGAREVVDDGVNGRLLNSDASEGQFAKMLIWSVTHREKVAQWSKTARKTAKSFSREQSVHKLQRLFADAVAARKENGGCKADDMDLWDKFLLACRTEWDLVAKKAESIIQTVDEEKQVVGLDESG